MTVRTIKHVFSLTILDNLQILLFHHQSSIKHVVNHLGAIR